MFVHLRVHTEYSIVDGMVRIPELLEAARTDGQAALAISDLSNIFATVNFYKNARSAGIKPLIAADVYYGEPRQRILLIAQNETGYLNLCQLLTQAWTQQGLRSPQDAILSWHDLEQHHAGLILLSGAVDSALGQALLQGDHAKAREWARKMAALFVGRFYIELQRSGRPEEETYIAHALALAQAEGLPVVATHPVQFLRPDEFEAHEARVCIAEGEILANPTRPRRFKPEQYFKTQAQMEALFADIPSAIRNTVLIAQRCNASLTLGQSKLPDYPTPMGADGTAMPIAEFFRSESQNGLEQRLTQLFPDLELRERMRPQYQERLEFELQTIEKMGFPGYFLIVADFIRWAKNNGCPVGPGRGSGAGSLVAYALQITDIDPLQYKLLFERFLNPERVSMPDFDIDFCQSNRDRVIDYVKEKYGREAVSQIATFGSMAARAVIRDVGRVMDFSYTFCDGISKLIPNKPGTQITIAKALQEEPLLAERAAREEDVKSLLEMAQKLEGLTRNVGMHAGGVLIAPSRLTDFCPLYQQPGSDAAVSQFDKDDVEAAGLVKFDFLGLATLTILELARKHICARHPECAHFDYAQLPLDDAKVYALFSAGKSEAVFQFESPGMRALLREAQPSRFEDLIALNAMFRPGPMENTGTFCARKHGREDIVYPHPLIEPILSETYGIMVYQEQVMQTAQILGGYSLGGADLLRRAMGKKKPEEMAEHRSIFREGAAKQGITQSKADEIFDLMEKFAGYGFNKSHAAAYSLLAYHTAWIKVHYCAEFFAANMTVEMGNTDKLQILIADAKSFGIEFEAPDVNQGEVEFIPISDTRIRYGLGAVKGSGERAVEAIMQARQESGPFTSLFDFCVRVDRSRINKRTVDALIKAGAFDKLHDNRAALARCIDLAFDFADMQEANALQKGLFDDIDSHAAGNREPDLPNTPQWTVRERLLQEKSALGFYLSGHMFEEFEHEVRQFVKKTLTDVSESREPQILAGIVRNLRIINGERGKRALFVLDDRSLAGGLEVVADESLLSGQDVQEDGLIVLQCIVGFDKFSGGLRLQARKIWDLPAARCRFAKHLHLSLPSNHSKAANAIEQLLQTHPAKREHSDDGELMRGVALRISAISANAQADFELGHPYRFYPSDDAMQAWRALCPNAQLKY